jgi:hypothetical protein
MSISTVYGYRCPKCKSAWDSYTKDYNGVVYCKNNKCNYKFSNLQVKITKYNYFESFTEKDLMIRHLEIFLKELKEFDNIYDKNICPTL